jgi:anti-anti-sigma factor
MTSTSWPESPVAAHRRIRERVRAAQMLTVLRGPNHGDLAVITVTGEIDVTSVGLLERTLWVGPPSGVVLDLSGVTFLAAAGLGMLVRAAERARAERQAFGIVAVTRPVLRVLRLTGLDTALPVFAYVSDAVRELTING